MADNVTLTHSPKKREVLFKGQYVFLMDLCRMYGIPQSTLSDRYKHGDRDERLVRPSEKKYIGPNVQDRINRKREKDGELVYPSDREPTFSTLSVEEVVENFMNDLEIEKEPEKINMGETTEKGGLHYYG